LSLIDFLSVFYHVFYHEFYHDHIPNNDLDIYILLYKYKHIYLSEHQPKLILIIPTLLESETSKSECF
jgi:hypothetical protein